MADKKISALTGASTPLAGTEVLPIVQSGSTVKVSVANLTAGRAVSTGALSVVAADATLDNAYSLKGKLAAGTAVSMIRRNSSDQVAIDEDGYGAVIGFSGFRLQVSGGNATLQNGNFVPSTAAKGINFTANTPAAGMTSQLLNWYEEGTWTPALAFGGAAVAMTYNAQAGTYTRIGRLVHCFARLSLSAKGSSTGSATITGLPFTSASGDASNGATMQPSLYAGMANLTGLSGYVGASSTTINLGNDGATETGSINATNFTDTTTIYFSVQYYV
jgi:hypothetical protein